MNTMASSPGVSPPRAFSADLSASARPASEETPLLVDRRLETREAPSPHLGVSRFRHGSDPFPGVSPAHLPQTSDPAPCHELCSGASRSDPVPHIFYSCHELGPDAQRSDPVSHVHSCLELGSDAHVRSCHELGPDAQRSDLVPHVHSCLELGPDTQRSDPVSHAHSCHELCPDAHVRSCHELGPDAPRSDSVSHAHSCHELCPGVPCSQSGDLLGVSHACFHPDAPPRGLAAPAPWRPSSAGATRSSRARLAEGSDWGYDLNYWSPELEAVARRTMKQASGYSWMYEKVVASAKRWGNFLTIVAGILAGIVGTEGLVTIFATGGATPLWVGVLTAIIGYSIAIVVILNNTWKLDVVRSEGLVAQVGFAQLNRSIMYQLALRPSERQDAREYVKGVLNEIETMKLSSPIIDRGVQKAYIEQCKDNPIYNTSGQWEDYRFRFRQQKWGASDGCGSARRVGGDEPGTEADNEAGGYAEGGDHVDTQAGDEPAEAAWRPTSKPEGTAPELFLGTGSAALAAPREAHLRGSWETDHISLEKMLASYEACAGS